MASDFPVTIHHNPGCSTSRNTLQLLRDQGHEPQVNEYLKTGWSRAELERLLGRLGLKPRDILRTKGALAEELGLLKDGVSDEAILTAMTQHPVLVERPIVETPKGARVCRPMERVQEIL